MDFKLGDLCHRIRGKLVGDGATIIKRLASLERASEGDISFLSDNRYQIFLDKTKASAVVVTCDRRGQIKHGIIHPEPYLAYAELSAIFAKKKINQEFDIDPRAIVSPSAKLGKGVLIGPGAVIQDDVHIGTNSIIGPNVVLYPGVIVGENCSIAAGTVVGADGFGFVKSKGRWLKIHQLGTVVIGDDVEIGALCAIDRGALHDTQIASGVKIDDKVMVAHGCFIGENSALAGCVALAGSTVLGKNVTVGGMTGFVGHIKICDSVHIGAKALVTRSIKTPGTYLGGSGGVMPEIDWRKNAIGFRHLYQLTERVKILERKSHYSGG